ncbi:hypothetical protein DDE18_20375 [Nocardioides gansuensis]|uniref:Uncharacterized protein n=1 Tax=Nocardioides gansuensis TaxID=2138300 RepID=A0A2T8F5C4_9ACTN|nr:hypothetical protein [Nocardioides gansuensis]PVG80928.1 hypothetical protein DDE18_20375 [Nocardioides gansuensis]
MSDSRLPLGVWLGLALMGLAVLTRDPRGFYLGVALMIASLAATWWHARRRAREARLAEGEEYDDGWGRPPGVS